MSGIWTGTKYITFNWKQCACAVKMRTSAFDSLAASSVYNDFASLDLTPAVQRCFLLEFDVALAV